ncbi:hypothetical protein HYU07_02940 [Candidatus Woesearchaeota archaeon]|nr:hypothetical protein [Candidatus Woesearchaeota archaeon]
MMKEYNDREPSKSKFGTDITELVRSIPLDRLVGKIIVTGTYTPYREGMTRGDFDKPEKIGLSTINIEEVISALQKIEPQYFHFQASFFYWYYRPIVSLSTEEAKVSSIRKLLGREENYEHIISVVRCYFAADLYSGEAKGEPKKHDEMTVKYFLK